MDNLIIYCKDFELTDAIKNYATEKIQFLNRYLVNDHGDISFNLRLGKTALNKQNGDIYYAELSIHTAEKNYGGRIEASDTYAALDLLKDELAHNIKHHKEKARTLDKREAKKFKDEIRNNSGDDVNNASDVGEV